MKKNVILLFYCMLCFAEEKPPLKSDIAEYLKLEIPRKNPFESLKPLSDKMGIPLPSLQDEEELAKTSQKMQQPQQKKFEGDVLNDYVLGSGFGEISTLLTQHISELLRDNDKGEILKIEARLNGEMGKENEVSGETSVLWKVYEDKNTTLELLGTSNLQSNQDWSGDYGFQQKFYVESLENMYFQYGLQRTSALIDDSVWKYGIGYAPFRNFSAIIEKEESEKQQDNTKASLYYRILF